MGIEEGLGKAIACLDFVVTKVEGDTVRTDCFPPKFDRKECAPFDYKAGQRYVRDIWENGEFVTSEETGETYLTRTGGAPIKVDGNLRDFIEKINSEGKQNRFNRLLKEGLITAFVRAHSYDGDRSLLEVVLVDKSDESAAFHPFDSNPFKAYSILVNLEDLTARIIAATCEWGSFDEDMTQFKAANPLKLPAKIAEIANPTDLLTHHDPKQLPSEAIAYIMENCYRPS